MIPNLLPLLRLARARALAVCGLCCTLALLGFGSAQAGSPPGDVVGKVVVGYQGWFSCAGDGSPVNNWGHQNLEMWPDVREYAKTYQTNHPNLGNREPARMFSAYDDQVVNTHFRWMAENGIDCAALQRFANEIRPQSKIKAQRDGMALKVMKAAEANGRKFYIMYDLSGSGVDELQADWTDTMVNTLHLLASPAYAKQNGKPVVSIYGFGYVRSRPSVEEALKTIQWFKDQGCYVIGSVPGQWRSGNGDSRADFESVYSALNMLSAWAVGRAVNPGYTHWIAEDLAYCNAHGIDYQPCIYPGTSFHNTNGKKKNQFPRMHGDFLWSQFTTIKTAGAASVYIAMFDELNEATSIFKCAEDESMVPSGEWFVTLDADGEHCSSDFYLRLVNEGGKMLKGLIPYQEKHTVPFVAPTAAKSP